MTKEEYLSELKINILSLTEDEQQEALQYYSDYFDEANDVEKVINELGSPTELAKSIIERFANVPVEVEKEAESESSENESFNASDALYFKFNPSEIKNLYCNLGAAEVVAIPGSVFSVETRGVQAGNFNCSLSSDGNLSINNIKRINLAFLSHERTGRIVPRILITIPEKMNFNKMRFSIGAGSFDSKSVNINYGTANVDVGAGSLVLGKINGGKINIRCGMGVVDITGKLKERINIDCGMGSVKLNLEGNPDKYSFDAKVGLGDFRMNNFKKSGVGNSVSGEKKENHFSVNCGMGSVNIQIG